MEFSSIVSKKNPVGIIETSGIGTGSFLNILSSLASDFSKFTVLLLKLVLTLSSFSSVTCRESLLLLVLSALLFDFAIILFESFEMEKLFFLAFRTGSKVFNLTK